MLTDRELQHMRDAVASLYPDTCNILTATSVSDSEGGYTQTWGTASANVACRLDVVQNMVVGERLTDSSLRAFYSYELTVPYDTTISENQRVELGDYTYAVSGIDKDVSWQVEKVVRVERL